MAILRLEPAHGLRPQDVDAVAAYTAEAARSSGLSDTTGYAAITVAEELCANVLEHSDARWLELELGANDGRAFVSVRDNGFPFDPAEAIRALEQGFVLAERTHRQLGLYIVQQLSHRVTYHRYQGENRLEVEVEPDGAAPHRNGTGG
jgi:anti-sigma regulatory factor (Ser/Thr protein kinase)